jgi:peptide/nickel transport system ATP-binding protein
VRLDGSVLTARELRVELASGSAIIEGVNLELAAGDILGLVGESGSGKTTTARSLFGYADRGVSRQSGQITVAGEQLDTAESLRRARGRLLSYVPQNPGTSLNPSLRVLAAIEDMLAAHAAESGPRSRRGPAATGLLGRVGLPADGQFGRRFPHQLSGGQQQRVCIAIALACDPPVVVLDEPTTGLDVLTQDRILAELVRLRDERGAAMLYITHDLAVVGQIASRIAVMYAGRIVEQGLARQILSAPRHPYTRGLVASTPDHLRPRVLEAMPGIAVGVGDRPAGCAFAPRCGQRTGRCETELPELAEISDGHLVRCFEWRSTRAVALGPLITASPEARADPVTAAADSGLVADGNLVVGTGADVRVAESAASDAGSCQAILAVEHLSAEYRGRGARHVAARDVSFILAEGGCVALVGESGSGKTTIARSIAGLHPPASGRILLAGQELSGRAQRRTTLQRRRVGIVFQNPAEALNPRHTVAAAIARPARLLRGLDSSEAQAEVDRLLDAVRLPARVARRYPGELSGGERQRVAIARALASGPEVLICDEVTSALDVSVQAAVLQLLRELRQELSVAILFITHDLGVVAAVAERTLVLRSGVICEQGPTAQVLGAPQHEYTRRLLAAAPSLSATTQAWRGPEPAAPLA